MLKTDQVIPKGESWDESEVKLRCSGKSTTYNKENLLSNRIPHKFLQNIGNFEGKGAKVGFELIILITSNAMSEESLIDAVNRSVEVIANSHINFVAIDFDVSLRF